jgi:hypothetical protein
VSDDVDYANLEPVDPDGPPPMPPEAYEVLPDGEYPYEEDPKSD